MIFDGPAQPSTDSGFVDIATAEVARQGAAVAVFREKHPAEHARIVQAVVGVKLAHQELEAAKVACAALPTGIPLGDILDVAERESRAQLKQLAEAATLAQIEQINRDASTRPPRTMAEVEQTSAKKKAS